MRHSRPVRSESLISCCSGYTQQPVAPWMSTLCLAFFYAVSSYVLSTNSHHHHPLSWVLFFLLDSVQELATPRSCLRQSSQCHECLPTEWCCKGPSRVPGLAISCRNSFHCPPVEATWGTVTGYLSLPIPSQGGISGKISEKHEFLLLLNNNRAPFPAKGISEAKCAWTSVPTWQEQGSPSLPPLSSVRSAFLKSRFQLDLDSYNTQNVKDNTNALTMEEPGKFTPEWERKPTDVAILPQEFKAGIIKMLQYAITNMLKQMKN